MFLKLFIGFAFALATLAIQVAAVVFMIQYLFRVARNDKSRLKGMKKTAFVISVIMLMLFVGHMLQVAIWAVLFMYVGEFNDFLTAFYHSMVNFASLGYGDIVMSEEWRLLGAIEATNGVLMFGLTAGVVLSVMSHLLAPLDPLEEQIRKMREDEASRASVGGSEHSDQAAPGSKE